MWDDKKEYNFSPLTMPKSDINIDLDGSYRIYRKNGEVVEVQANSAAESIAKSGITDAVKIISMSVIRKKIMDKNILSPIDEMVETNIDIDKDAPTGLDFLFVKDEKILKNTEKPEFEELGLGKLAKLSNLIGNSNLEKKNNKKIIQENKIEMDNDIISDELVEDEIIGKKELSSKEVENLLSEDSADGDK